MLQVLASVACEKEMYGLGNVNLSQVEIGREIPTYKVDDGKLKNCDIHIVPVLQGGDVVSCFFYTEDQNGEIYAQLSNGMADGINAFSDSGELLVVYDDDGAYIYADGHLSLLGLAEPYSADSKSGSVSADESENRNSVFLLKEDCLKSLDGVSVMTDVIFNVEEYCESLPEIKSVNSSKYLDVERLKQPAGTEICWAIACTSIVNFIFKYSLTYDTIVSWFNNGVEESMAPEDVIINVAIKYCHINNMI